MEKKKIARHMEISLRRKEERKGDEKEKKERKTREEESHIIRLSLRFSVRDEKETEEKATRYDFMELAWDEKKREKEMKGREKGEKKNHKYQIFSSYFQIRGEK